MASEKQNHGRRSDRAVMDVQEFKQKDRLERILNKSLKDVQDEADDAWREYVQGEISRTGRNIHIQRAVKNAIRESYILLLSYAREQGGRDKYWAGEPDNPLGVVTLLDEQWKIVGLRDYLNSPRFYDVTVTETIERRNLADEQVTHTQDKSMPEEISYNAFMRLKEFLGIEEGIELQFETRETEEHAEPW